MKFRNRTEKAPGPAPLADTAPADRAWEMPTGSFDLIGGRFTVRARARSVILSLAGGAVVAAAVLGLQALNVRAELRDAERREQSALAQRTTLSAELQSLIGGGALTQEQITAHLDARRSLAVNIARRDPAADQLLDYLASTLPVSITVTAVNVDPAAAPATPSGTTPSGNGDDEEAAASTTSTSTPAAGPATPAGWPVTVTANASSLADVSAFERVLAASPQLSGVTVTWSDGSAIVLTARGTLSADTNRVVEVTDRFGGVS